MKIIILLIIFIFTYTPVSAQIMSEFNGNRAFLHLETILSFGPRITGTKGHKAELDYVENKLKMLGYTTRRFEFKSELKRFRNMVFTNIYTIPDTTEEVKLFSAHLDTLPNCPRDPDASKRHIPLTGANDGASGVAFLINLHG